MITIRKYFNHIFLAINILCLVTLIAAGLIASCRAELEKRALVSEIDRLRGIIEHRAGSRAPEAKKSRKKSKKKTRKISRKSEKPEAENKTSIQESTETAPELEESVLNSPPHNPGRP